MSMAWSYAHRHGVWCKGAGKPHLHLVAHVIRAGLWRAESSELVDLCEQNVAMPLRVMSVRCLRRDVDD